MKKYKKGNSIFHKRHGEGIIIKQIDTNGYVVQFKNKPEGEFLNVDVWDFYDPYKEFKALYNHRELPYTCKYVGLDRKNKPTYEVVASNCDFKIGDQFTPINPERWFEIKLT